jgi:hypothetical protein
MKLNDILVYVVKTTEFWKQNDFSTFENKKVEKEVDF